MSAMPTLLPCPFCGGKARINSPPRMRPLVEVACDGRGCDVLPQTDFHAEECAIAIWNSRAGGHA